MSIAPALFVSSTREDTSTSVVNVTILHHISRHDGHHNFHHTFTIDILAKASSCTPSVQDATALHSLVLTILLLSVMSGPIGIAVNGEQIAQESVWRLSFSTSSASSSTTDVATISALPSSTTSAYPEVFSGLNSNSPGIDNIPIKHITGIGGHNGTQKVTYPNKHGNAECKLFKGCVDNTGGFTQPCLQSLQHSIYQVAGATPNATFRPFDRIACAPGGNGASDYCAFVQYPKWTPKNEKVQGQFDRMFTDLYKDMELDAIPIGAIRAGIDWIVEGGAKLCGNALLPVPNMFGNGGMQGHVYILTVDIDHGLRRKNHDCVGQP